ncbi:hypothetical protein FJZ20_00970 [Candidatus Pacearchaeota archaeon]|nr:hypothetical protein [Candidatus Pacearchaeota archaeon]
MVNKKAQMKIQQMAFMLIAVTLFFVLVGLFFLRISFSELRTSAELIEEKNALLLVSKLANSPEFSCENAFGGIKINCIDSDKIMALKNNINKYSGFWGVSGIEIRKIYPSGNLVECSSSNYPNCNYLKILPVPSDSGVGVSNFVALCRIEEINNSVQDRCDLAKILVYYGGAE